MWRPEYGPPETFSTGASGPKPSIPSWTIVPEAIATSIAREPHSPPIEISIPWSSDQVLGGDTRLSGRSGNTSVFVEVVGLAPPEERRTPLLAACLTADWMAAAVRRPT